MIYFNLPLFAALFLDSSGSLKPLYENPRSSSRIDPGMAGGADRSENDSRRQATLNSILRTQEQLATTLLECRERQSVLSGIPLPDEDKVALEKLRNKDGKKEKGAPEAIDIQKVLSGSKESSAIKNFEKQYNDWNKAVEIREKLIEELRLKVKTNLANDTEKDQLDTLEKQSREESLQYYERLKVHLKNQEIKPVKP